MTAPQKRWARTWLIALFATLSAAALNLPAVANSGTDPKTTAKNNDSQQPSDPQKPAETVDLICLAAKRPIVIRLRIMVDGQSTSAFRASIARRLFDTLDTDKNGLLEGKELSSLPTPQMLAAASRDPDLTAAPGSKGSTSPAPRIAGKGRITPEEWARSLFPASSGPLSRVSMAATAAERMTSPLDMDTAANAGGLTVLLSAIDANSDGRLSASELSRLDDLFRLLDLNDDEQIPRSEFVAPVDSRWIVERSDSAKGGSAVPFEQIPRTADKTELVGRLIRTFGSSANDAQGRAKDATGKQPSKRPGLPLSIFGATDAVARFDKDDDKRLDERELADWLSDPQPHCELAVEMAALSLQEPQVKVIRVLPAAREAGLSVEPASSGGPLLHLSSIPLELRAAEPARRAAARTSRYRAMFKRADQNNNNYIESSEIANAGQGLGPVDFSAMDRDHNGMVFEDEWIAYLRLRDALAEARLSLTIAVESIDPLAQFDANHDGRLNRAEFGRALAAVASWDRNRDGFVTPDEIPRTLVGTFHIAPLRAAPVRRPRSARMERSQPPSAAGPIWFQKMDRNHDGEVSLREFLGPLSVFRRLDANGDGRLDPHEAESAQK